MKILTYAILALFIAISALCAVYYVEAKRQEAVIEVMANNLVETRSHLEATRKSIAEVQRSMTVADGIIGNLHTALTAINDKGSIVTERIIMLEKNNAEIRDLLDTRLPADGCLLDDTCTAPRNPSGVRQSGPSSPTRVPSPTGEDERGSP